MSRCDREGGGSLVRDWRAGAGRVTQAAVIVAYPPGLQLSSSVAEGVEV